MLNIIVVNTPGLLEEDVVSIPAERFNEFSGTRAKALALDLDEPESLAQLERFPTLLMYELGTDGPNAAVVRYGRVEDIRRYGEMLEFTFLPDPDAPYLPRDAIVEFERHLSLTRFAQGRLHWSIKDGDLPRGLMKKAFRALPERSAAEVHADLDRAEAKGRRAAAAAYATELARVGADATQAGEAGSPERQMMTSQAALAAGGGLTVRPGRVCVVIIGIETYSPRGKINRVDYARADAEAFAGAAKRIWPDAEITMLLDEKATRGEMIAAVKDNAYADQFVFYYAGHGFHDGGGNRLTTYDTVMSDAADTTFDVERHLLAPLRQYCPRVLAFIDACATHLSTGGRRALRPMTDEDYRAFVAKAEYAAVFTACRPGEESFPLSRLGHGAWTYSLVEALEGRDSLAIDPRGFISGDSLQTALAARVKDLLKDGTAQMKLQTPWLYARADRPFPIVLELPTPTGPKSDPVVPAPATSARSATPCAPLILEGFVYGRVDRLEGFHKPSHKVLPKVTPATRRFVRTLTDPVVASERQKAFTQAVAAFGLRPSQLVRSADTISGPGFQLQLTGEQDDENPAQWVLHRRLTLTDPTPAVLEMADAAFGTIFNYVVVDVLDWRGDLDEVQAHLEVVLDSGAAIHPDFVENRIDVAMPDGGVAVLDFAHYRARLGDGPRGVASAIAARADKVSLLPVLAASPASGQTIQASARVGVGGGVMAPQDATA